MELRTMVCTVATAALITAGAATLASPVTAATGNVDYDCNNVLTGPFVATAVIDTDAPAELATGQTVPITLSTSVVVPAEVVTDLRDAGIATVSGTGTANGIVDGAPRQATLTVPSTAVPGAGNTMTLVGSGPAGTITAGAVGSTILIGAGDFSVTLNGYNTTGGLVTTQTVTCLQQGSQLTLIDSVAVVKAPTTTTLRWPARSSTAPHPTSPPTSRSPAATPSRPERWSSPSRARP